MRLSLYTFIRNGLRLDFHAVEMLRHHLPLADEIIVNEGYSTDGSFEAISRIDPKIQVFRSHWGDAPSFEWYQGFKNDARRRCTGDWCICLDCDEFIPEWQFEDLRRYLATSPRDLVPLEVVNFYGNYRVYHTMPESVYWPARKMPIHRNRPDIEFWGDGSNVQIKGQPFEWPDPPWQFSCHHFGFVRHASRLREKWREQGEKYSSRRQRIRLPAFAFDLLPHRWDDPTFAKGLAIYAGPFIEPVRQRPEEFVRDDMRLFRKLELQTRSVRE